MKYHKIQTVFKRNPETMYKTLLEGEWSLPEFAYLANNEWEFTEKVDGTNIRIIYTRNIFNNSVEFRGRTDRAQIPPFLIETLKNLFPIVKFDQNFEHDVVLYGEGYGNKIQKTGSNYRKDNSFVLFDIMINGSFLPRQSVEGIAKALEIEVVPVIGKGTLYAMVEMARSGFNSQWGNFTAEGIVARPTTELCSKNGGRIITKIKCRDFQ